LQAIPNASEPLSSPAFQVWPGSSESVASWPTFAERPLYPNL